MFCKNCGAQIEDGARFCNECGAAIAPAETMVPPAAEREDNELNAAPPANTPVQPPVSPAQPTAAPVYGAAQTGYPQPQPGNPPVQGQPGGYPQQPGYAPQQPQPGNPPRQGQPGGYPQSPQPGYAPQAQPNGYPQQQAAYPYPAQAAPNGGAKQKKSHAAVIILAVLLALVILVGVLFFVFIKLREEEPPLPALTTEPIETEITSEEDTDPATTDAAETTAAVTEPGETTVPATQPANGELTDAQAKEVLEKLTGYWNSDDDTIVLSVTREEGGKYFFSLGYWYSEIVMKGWLQQPIKGDPYGEVYVWLYFEGEGSEEEYMYIPAQNGAMLFDLSDREGSRLRWKNGDKWEDFYFAGNTAEEAMPPMN